MSAKDNNTNTNIYRSYIDALLYPEQNPFIEDMQRFEDDVLLCDQGSSDQAGCIKYRFQRSLQPKSD